MSEPVIPELDQWTQETMQMINALTPDIHGKAFDPDWFLLRQRFEAAEAKVAEQAATIAELEKKRDEFQSAFLQTHKEWDAAMNQKVEDEGQIARLHVVYEEDQVVIEQQVATIERLTALARLFERGNAGEIIQDEEWWQGQIDAALSKQEPAEIKSKAGGVNDD